MSLPGCGDEVEEIWLVLGVVGVAIRVGGVAGVLIGVVVVVGWGSLAALVWTSRR
ncbi:MAG: hypothetical protein RIE08_06075 [Acidimicrobiales bacterium]